MSDSKQTGNWGLIAALLLLLLGFILLLAVTPFFVLCIGIIIFVIVVGTLSRPSAPASGGKAVSEEAPKQKTTYRALGAPPPPPPPLPQQVALADLKSEGGLLPDSGIETIEKKLGRPEIIKADLPSENLAPSGLETSDRDDDQTDLIGLLPLEIGDHSALQDISIQDEPVTVYQPVPSLESFKLPPKPKEYSPAAWIPANESITVHGIEIPSGMVYLGRSLPTFGGPNDPCLIDPSKPVASYGDYKQRLMDYWPSYSEISPQARHAYLCWLANGRQDPSADIGYVFLFFYGLERRVLIDTFAQAEVPSIAAEVRRLLSIYGAKSSSFRGYASEFLDWISSAEIPQKLYESDPQKDCSTFRTPLHVRIALGQASMNRVPVPPRLALAWVRNHPGITLRTPAVRCASEFDRLFMSEYTKKFDAGIVLPRNRTKLSIVYRPASLGFQGTSLFSRNIEELPDVSVLSGPIKKLQSLVDETTKQLDSYSRFVAKRPQGLDGIEGLLRLPITIWPDHAHRALENLMQQIEEDMLTIKLKRILELLSPLELGCTSLPRSHATALAQALLSKNICIEPDILGGARVPKLDDSVVLFTCSSGEQSFVSDASYEVAMLTLQLASAVAMADGSFSQQEISHLHDLICGWGGLNAVQKRRLLAHLKLLVIAPASLSVLRKKCQSINSQDRNVIASFMASVASADGNVSPEDIKTLKQVYAALGVDSDKVFSDLHLLATGEAPTASALTLAVQESQTGFSLDRQRIALRKQDTEKVQGLLASIFAEPEDTRVVEPSSECDDSNNSFGSDEILMGLDEAHSVLTRRLLTQLEWTRESLLDATGDLDLMLDGALELINEAAFDHYDVPFFEGYDPLLINSELRDRLIP